MWRLVLSFLIVGCSDVETGATSYVEHAGGSVATSAGTGGSTGGSAGFGGVAGVAGVAGAAGTGSAGVGGVAPVDVPGEYGEPCHPIRGCVSGLVCHPLAEFCTVVCTDTCDLMDGLATECLDVGAFAEPMFFCTVLCEICPEKLSCQTFTSMGRICAGDPV